MPPARLDLLGGFRLISGDGRPLDVPAKKNRALLGILSLAPHREATRERLAGLLWSDRGEEQARSSLRQALASLRKDLAGLDGDPLVLAGDRVRLDPTLVTVDVSEFLAASAGADATDLRRAADLYAGPFLDGLSAADAAFEDWLREARADLAARAIKAIESLAAALVGAERVAFAERLVALDPLREASHLALMQAHIAQGDAALAIRQFESCKLLLKRELGVEPGEELRKLRRSLDSRPGQPPPAAPSRKPVIAVLPFENMSGDPGQQYFSDGITEDIIDRLSKYRILSVIGLHSSFALRGRDAEARAVGDRLSADYVLTGNIRKSADRIRIAARLTDVGSEAALWADRYDRPLTDIFAVQDEIAGVIAATLVGRIELEVATRSPAASAASISSYEHVLKGLWHFRKLTPATTDVAAGCFERAIAAYPENAEAYRWLSGCHFDRWLIGFSCDELAKGLQVAVRAAELDPASALCHTAVGLCRIWAEGVDAAAPSFEKALALNPGDPEVQWAMAQLQVYAGDLAASRDFLGQALRLNPLPAPWYAECRAIGDFIEGRYAEALPAFLAIPNAAFDAMYGLACAGHLGDSPQIAACKARFEPIIRRCDLLAAAKAEPFRDPEPRQRLVAGLEKAFALH